MTTPLRPRTGAKADTETKGKAPDYGDQGLPLPNLTRCLDEDMVFEVHAIDGVYIDCPNDPSHAVEGLFENEEPLGFTDDDQYFDFGRKAYTYPAQEIYR